MNIHYYLEIFPAESLIASQLDPEEFGLYMARGAQKKSSESIMFIELKGEFGDTFDWEYAKKNCVAHEDGRPKNSLYLSVYRVLENIPSDQLGKLYLTTRDGRTLALDPESFSPPAGKSYQLYQELAPITPLVVSGLDPIAFADYITSGKQKIHAPKIVFADLKVMDLNDPENTGNVGHLYDRNLAHLRNCIDEVKSKNKKSKTLERSYGGSFSYQVIDHGVYVAGKGEEITMYKMKTIEELKKENYDWGRSALIL